MSIKISCENEIRRVGQAALNYDSWDSFCQQVRELFNRKLPGLGEGGFWRLQYVDDEGDKVIIGSGTELAEAVSLARGTVLRLFVVKKAQPKANVAHRVNEDADDAEKQMTALHQHSLAVSELGHAWVCDSPAQCSHQGPRWRCTEGCDFDLCGDCMQSQSEQAVPGAADCKSQRQECRRALRQARRQLAAPPAPPGQADAAQHVRRQVRLLVQAAKQQFGKHREAQKESRRAGAPTAATTDSEFEEAIPLAREAFRALKKERQEMKQTFQKMKKAEWKLACSDTEVTTDTDAGLTTDSGVADSVMAGGSRVRLGRASPEFLVRRLGNGNVVFRVDGSQPERTLRVQKGTVSLTGRLGKWAQFKVDKVVGGYLVHNVADKCFLLCGEDEAIAASETPGVITVTKV